MNSLLLQLNQRGLEGDFGLLIMMMMMMMMKMVLSGEDYIDSLYQLNFQKSVELTLKY